MDNPLRNQGKRPKSVNLAAPPEWSGIDRSFCLLSVMPLQKNGDPKKLATHDCDNNYRQIPARECPGALASRKIDGCQNERLSE